MGLYWCEHAWLPPGRVATGVVVAVEQGRIASVAEDVAGAPPGTRRLSGLVLPGLANAHSHAFHRALRGRTHGGAGDFWTWRDQMYAVADLLDPDSYLALARAVFAEMALAGVTRLGEFHYMHHAPGGVPYNDPNAMALALVEAASSAGVRLTLLDTCYLTGGIDRPLDAAQRRFADHDADRWAERADALRAACADRDTVVVGAAAHSVRAVPAAQISTVAKWAQGNDVPLHVHVSEQVAENEACLARYGRTPTGLLHDQGALGPGTTAVHATHISDADARLLGASATAVCMCPTTERDLADGIGRPRRLLAAGSPICLGSDSHAVIDLFEEARAVELGERLASQQRGHWSAAQLLQAATAAGHASLGCSTGGRLAVGAPADLVVVRLDSVRTAGARGLAEAAVFAATATDVTDVVCSGQPVVVAGTHMLGDVGRMLDEAIGALR